MPQTTNAPTLGATDILSALNPSQQDEIAARFETLQVKRGDVLVHEGRSAIALYIVVIGRFAVTRDGASRVVSEIFSGQPIGEIAFLTGARRTATVTAMRDSVVLRLERNMFDAACADNPGLWRVIACSLAERLQSTMTQDPRRSASTPRTFAIIPAGSSTVPAGFVDQLAELLGAESRTKVVTSKNLDDIAGPLSSLESDDARARLNALEMDTDIVVYTTDNTHTPWSERAIRQADVVLSVAHFGADPQPNALEQFSWTLLPPEDRRLILLHPNKGRIRGTRDWLAPRDVRMHHHVAFDDPETLARLARFLLGKASGLVACGGGALCAAHIGVYKALAEQRLTFDYFGGTSAGSAMVGAFALGVEPETVSKSLESIFISNKAMGRYTWPRYGLLDHGNFDRQLTKYFGGHDIEDLWVPFFAASTNLSRHRLEVHKTGDLFTAIRASSSIPVLLPPVYNGSGEMLVDGCLLDNIPVGPMHALKQGPNIVISFPHTDSETFEVDYSTLPSGGRLIAQSLNPLARKDLPVAPGVVSVLMRSLMANRNDFSGNLEGDDILLTPPLPKDARFLDWHRHGEISDGAYRWTRDEVARLLESQPTVMQTFPRKFG